MTLEEWKLKHPSINLCATPMRLSEVVSILADELLPKGWRIPYPCNNYQALAEVVAAVVERHRPWYRKPSTRRTKPEEKQETPADIAAEMRRGFNQSWHDIDRKDNYDSIIAEWNKTLDAEHFAEIPQQ